MTQEKTRRVIEAIAETQRQSRMDDFDVETFYHIGDAEHEPAWYYSYCPHLYVHYRSEAGPFAHEHEAASHALQRCKDVQADLIAWASAPRLVVYVDTTVTPNSAVREYR